MADELQWIDVGGGIEARREKENLIIRNQDDHEQQFVTDAATMFAALDIMPVCEPT